ncbi:MAG: DUF2236 domain-containing protein [Deltaproteobacteria bacterium]|nr:DUF2236 domain-containing protein [Deltaproteobacteria bacterium]
MALSDQALDEASLRADPVADAAVVAMFAQGVRGGDLLAAAKERQSSPAIAALLAEADRAPVNPEAMERTRRLVLRYAPPIGLALGLKALPTLYALPEIAEALVATGRLIQHGERRMLETAEYLNQLTLPGGMRRDGVGHDATLRVRLLHAASRVRLRQAGWSRPTPPIDQRACLFTLTVFSHSLRAGLTQLGGRLTAQESSEHLAFWRHVGPVLGVEAGLIAERPEEEAELQDRLLRERAAPSEAGRALTAALLGALADRPPYRLSFATLAALSRHLLGDPLAELLGIPKDGDSRRLRAGLALGQALLRAEAVVPGGRLFSQAFGRAFSNGVLAWRLRGPSEWEGG